ncbi:cysteine proteinase inhibitor-like [Vicia villosa]|uniref:cysteine proteinase inhibitor-like n=1 Tax=Vicia villosa TaxID=3911 RepID=UPI00273BBD41|nr:cysteine proteinase inhibitor-like [Vicia villosa]
MDVNKKEEEKVEEEYEDSDDDMCVGQIEECEDIPKLNSLAGFGVDQHNKKENANLKFVEAINGTGQWIGAGMSYHITFKAKDEEKGNMYETEVWEQPWSNYMELCEFKLVGDASSVGC